MNAARNGSCFYEWRHIPPEDWTYPFSWFDVLGIHYYYKAYEMTEFYFGKGLILRVVRILD